VATGDEMQDGTGGICFAGSGGWAQRAGALAAAVTTSAHDCPRTGCPIKLTNGRTNYRRQ
jgi:hypothetical protein